MAVRSGKVNELRNTRISGPGGTGTTRRRVESDPRLRVQFDSPEGRRINRQFTVPRDKTGKPTGTFPGLVKRIQAPSTTIVPRGTIGPNAFLPRQAPDTRLTGGGFVRRTSSVETEIERRNRLRRT